MASGVTNRGRYLILEWALRAAVRPTNFYLLLATSAAAPTVDTNTVADVTQIAAGNGYVDGGYQITPGATDLDVLTEDDSGDLALIQLKDIVWTASAGPIPITGNGARWALLTTDEVTISTRQVIAWFDLVSDRAVSDGQTITIQDSTVRLTL